MLGDRTKLRNVSLRLADLFAIEIIFYGHFGGKMIIKHGIKWWILAIFVTKNQHDIQMLTLDQVRTGTLQAWMWCCGDPYVVFLVPLRIRSDQFQASTLFSEQGAQRVAVHRASCFAMTQRLNSEWIHGLRLRNGRRQVGRCNSVELLSSDPRGSRMDPSSGCRWSPGGDGPIPSWVNIPWSYHVISMVISMVIPI